MSSDFRWNAVSEGPGRCWSSSWCFASRIAAMCFSASSHAYARNGSSLSPPIVALQSPFSPWLHKRIISLVFFSFLAVFLTFCFPPKYLSSSRRRRRRLHGSSTGYRVCTKHNNSRKSDFFGIGSMSYPRWLPSLQAKTWFWFSACTIVAANAKAVESNSPSSTFSAVLSFSFFVILRSKATLRRMFTCRIIDSTRF